MKKLPLVSFLVAMRNEAAFIAQCIHSLLAQDYPNIEILVFDGGSKDNSKAIVDDLFKSRNNCILFDNPAHIQAAAWNQGIRLAKGQILTIVSAHSELSPDFATNVVETLERTGADMVGGPTFADSKGYVAKVIALALNSPFGVGGAAFHYTTREIEVDTVFMGSCWRGVYEKIGGFDEEMVRNQDDELSYRLLENRGKIICNPAIKSRYYNRATLRGLTKQYFQYGFWKVRVLQKHPRQMRLRQFVPLAFVVALILTFLLSLMFPWGWKALLALLAVYLLANLSASIIAASGQGFKKLILLPLAFAIIHLSYGLGFLGGLFKFWNRWHDKKGRVPPLNWQT